MRRISGAYNFGNAFSKRRKGGDEEPEPPRLPARHKGENSEGDQQKSKTGEGLRYPVCKGCGPAMLKVAIATLASILAAAQPARRSFGKLAGQGLRNKRKVASTRAAELRVVGVRSRALGAVHWFTSLGVASINS